MAIEFDWIVIIDNAGTLLFGCKRTTKWSFEDIRLVLYNFLFTLRTFAKDLVLDQIKRIEMGNNQYILTQDASKTFLFIVKCDRNADADLIKPILIEIKQKFVEKFANYSFLAIPEKQDLVKSFKEVVKKVVQSFNLRDVEFLSV